MLRQQAIAGGAGGSRVHLKRLAAAAAAGDGAPGAEGGAAASTKSGKGRGPKGAMGYEGEDVVSGWTGDGPLKLLLPVRFGDSTWMAAAWKVLSEAGAEGLPVAEVSPACCACSSVGSAEGIAQPKVLLALVRGVRIF